MRVRNCAIASSTFAVMSWSSRIAIEVNARSTATANDVAEMVFSRRRVIRYCRLTKDSCYLSFE